MKTITSPAKRSFLGQHYGPLLFLNFDGITSTIILKLFLRFHKGFFEAG